MKGRIPVFETLKIDDDVENLILQKKSDEEIWRLARSKGMVSVREDAMIKSMDGIVPFSEIHEL